MAFASTIVILKCRKPPDSCESRGLPDFMFFCVKRYNRDGFARRTSPEYGKPWQVPASIVAWPPRHAPELLRWR